MKEYAFGLLVSGRALPESLRAALREMDIATWTCESCQEVSTLLDQTHPQLVFTDTQLSDGSWRDVVNMAQQATSPVNVIVVGRTADMQFYLSVIESGAFDYFVPPFELVPLQYVVRLAVEDVRGRRTTLARMAVA